MGNLNLRKWIDHQKFGNHSCRDWPKQLPDAAQKLCRMHNVFIKMNLPGAYPIWTFVDLGHLEPIFVGQRGVRFGLIMVYYWTTYVWYY